MTWGPFAAGIDRAEQQTRLRCLRLALRLLCGPRSLDARHAVLRAEIDPDGEFLRAAAAEFDRLPAIDQRRVLSAMHEVVRAR